MNLKVQNITLQNIKNSDYLDLANIMIWGFKDYYGKHITKIRPEFTECKIGNNNVIKIIFPGNDRIFKLHIYEKGNIFAYVKMDGESNHQTYPDHPLEVANWLLRHGFLSLNITLNNINITN